jgi:hypothetical protein
VSLRSGQSSPTIAQRSVSWYMEPALLEATRRAATDTGRSAHQTYAWFGDRMKRADIDTKLAGRTLEAFFSTPQQGGVLQEPADDVEFLRTLRRMSRQGASLVVATPTAEEQRARSSTAHVVPYYGLAFVATVLAAHSNACTPPATLTIVRSRLRVVVAYWNRERIDLAADLAARITELRDRCRGAGKRFAAIVLDFTDADIVPGGGHMNMLLVDTVSSAVFHFEPHGAGDVADPDQLRAAGLPSGSKLPPDLTLSAQLAAAIGPAMTFVPAVQITCPSWLAQAQQALPYLGLQYTEPLCQIWSVMFLDACLSLPDLVRPDNPSGFADLVFRALRHEPSPPNPMVSLLLFYYIRMYPSLLWFVRELLVTLGGILDPGMPADVLRGRLTDEDVDAAADSFILAELLEPLLSGRPNIISERREVNSLLHALGVLERDPRDHRRSRLASDATLAAARSAAQAPAPRGPRPPAALLRPDPDFVPMVNYAFYDAHVAVDPFWTGAPDFPELATSAKAQGMILAAFPMADLLRAGGHPDPDAFLAANAGRFLTDVLTHGLSPTLSATLGQAGYDRIMDRSTPTPELHDLVARELWLNRYLRRQQMLRAAVLSDTVRKRFPDEELVAHSTISPQPMHNRNISFAEHTEGSFQRARDREAAFAAQHPMTAPVESVLQEHRRLEDRVLQTAIGAAGAASLAMRAVPNPPDADRLRDARLRSLEAAHAIQTFREMEDELGRVAAEVAQAERAERAAQAAQAAPAAPGGPSGP